MVERVEVVVLNWLDTAATVACLASLARQTYANFGVIVVHNGPAQADLAPLSEAGINFRLIRNPHNLGFAGGVNVGIRAALAGGASHVWLLNSDAEAAPDALAHLVEAAEAEAGIGLVAPAMRNINDEDRPDLWGGVVERRHLAFHMSAREEDWQAWCLTAPDRIWLAGAALLVRREVAERIGLFDEALFAYWEDQDYSIRSFQAGFRNILVPAAVVWHRAKAPDPIRPTKPPYYYYYTARNYLRLLRKYGGWRANARPLAWALARELTLAHRLRASPATVQAICAGLRDGLVGRGGEYDPTRTAGRLAARLAPTLGGLLARHWLRRPGRDHPPASVA